MTRRHLMAVVAIAALAPATALASPGAVEAGPPVCPPGAPLVSPLTDVTPPTCTPAPTDGAAAAPQSPPVTPPAEATPPPTAPEPPTTPTPSPDPAPAAPATPAPAPAPAPVAESAPAPAPAPTTPPVATPSPAAPGAPAARPVVITTPPPARDVATPTPASTPTTSRRRPAPPRVAVKPARADVNIAALRAFPATTPATPATPVADVPAGAPAVPGADVPWDPTSRVDAIVGPLPPPIPDTYLPLYREAAKAAGVRWSLLAAIGSVESDHGRSTAPGVRSGLNFANCCAGPMQFNVANGTPSTWDTYAVDADGDGSASPYTPADAIHAAATKLVADGALEDEHRALLRYNNSEEYVQEVLRRASAYQAMYPSGSYAPPVTDAAFSVIGVPGQGTHTLGNWQSDNAIDVSVPHGTPLRAVCSGRIGGRLGSTSGGMSTASRFGGLKLTLDCGAEGAGNSFWYGHLSAYAPGIAVGRDVERGQIIGLSGTANGVPHLHLGARFGDPRIVLPVAP